MKAKILSVGFLLLIALLVSLGTTPQATGQAGAGKSCDEHLLTILNPAIETKMAERVPLAPRQNTVEGKTIYMVDLQWGGPQAGYSVFEEIQKWFAQNMPSVKTEIRRSKGGAFGDDPGLRKEILQNKAAGVIIGIAG